MIILFLKFKVQNGVLKYPVFLCNCLCVFSVSGTIPDKVLMAQRKISNSVTT